MDSGGSPRLGARPKPPLEIGASRLGHLASGSSETERGRLRNRVEVKGRRGKGNGKKIPFSVDVEEPAASHTAVDRRQERGCVQELLVGGQSGN